MKKTQFLLSPLDILGEDQRFTKVLFALMSLQIICRQSQTGGNFSIIPNVFTADRNESYQSLVGVDQKATKLSCVVQECYMNWLHDNSTRFMFVVLSKYKLTSLMVLLSQFDLLF